MRLALAVGGALLLALLTWLLLRGIDTNASAYADTQRAFDDFALAEASIGRDVLQARAGLLGNYDVLVEAEAAMDRAVSQIRLRVEAEHLDPKPVERLAAAVGQYEDLIERFKSGNALRQNSLAYVGQLSTDPIFGAPGDRLAASATALAAAVLRLARESSAESARSLQQQIDRFEAQAPTDGPVGEAAHALLAHARLLTELSPEVDQTLRDLVASPTRQPLEETRELLARAQAAVEATAQRFRVLLYAVSLGLLVIALRLGQRLWTRTLRIRRLVDANIMGIFIWDLDGRIIEANDAFLRMVGYDHADIVSGRMRWTELTPPEWLDRDKRGWLPELKVTGSLQPFEKEYFRKDGSRVPVLIGVATFEGGGKEGVAFVLDLSERKRAEEAFRELQSDLAHMNRVSMMGELAGSLSHEIMQPIGSARNNARAALNFMDRQPPDLGKVREALGCAVGDADRAGDIIERVRDHIKKAPPRKHHFDLNEAINAVLVLARSAIAKNGVSVQTRLMEGRASVEGDRVQLQQVVMNLILNAVEAMGSVEAGSRELLISTEQTEANGVLVAVRDSGPGIDPEHVERVFEAFYTTKPSGVGMGLSICRSIIDAHGGRLWADANEPRGAVFQFTLPGAEGELSTNYKSIELQRKESHQRTAGRGAQSTRSRGPGQNSGVKGPNGPPARAGERAHNTVLSLPGRRKTAGGAARKAWSGV
jgi:PAS domain S-box-containing protein